MADASDTPVESIRVLSVGIGTFLIAAALLLWLLFSILAKVFQTKILYLVGFLIALIIVLVLTLSPRAAPGSKSGATHFTATPVYSTYYLGATLMASALAIAVAASCIGITWHSLLVSRRVRLVD